MRLKIASRKSDLARIQAYQVGEALKNQVPSLNIEYAFRESLGDKNLSDPLWKLPERGVFTEDFYQDLVQGDADLVVHSWKDLPVETRKDTEIYATLPRADARDLLLLKKSHQDKIIKSKELKVFSSSPRRSYNLTPFFKEFLPWELNQVEFESVRGNVATRIRKLLESPEVDSLIVAKAAIDRLLSAQQEEFLESKNWIANQLKELSWMCLPLSLNPTAAAQGALAIEIRKDREDIKKILDLVNCKTTFAIAQKERETLKKHGGGCHQKIGISILSRSFGEVTYLQGLTEQGLKLEECSLESKNSQTLAAGAAKPDVSQVWPQSVGENFFDREELNVDVSRLQKMNLWVSRAPALPQNYQPQESQLIWAAGLETWKKLARRGFWVNGSAESLGEQEPMRIQSLQIDSRDWLKLTHQAAVKMMANEEMLSLATYKLNSKKEGIPNLNGKTHFFWMSGSSFLRALELYPEIHNQNHFCGPGNTHEILKKALGATQKLHVRLSYKNWLKEMGL